MQIDESDQTRRHVKFNDWLKASATLAQGDKRKTMEDRICISNFEHDCKKYHVFLLLDGHGGAEVAEFTCSHFTKVMGEHTIKSKGRDVRKIIKDTFLTINEQVRHMQSGSTASLLLAISSGPDARPDIWIANVGDSTVYGIDYDNGARKLSVDHNVKFRSERERILKDGSLAITDNGYVGTEDGNMLAVTRALGDVQFGAAVTAEPYVVHVKTKYPLFALASDGLWDVVSGKDLLNQIYPPKQRKAWRDSAYRINKWRQSTFPQHDNSSLILVFVGKTKPKEKSEKTVSLV